MNTEILDSLKTVVDSTKAVVDSTLVDAASIAEKSIWQDKSLMTVLAFIGGIILLGSIYLILDARSDRKDRKEREQSKKEK